MARLLLASLFSLVAANPGSVLAAGWSPLGATAPSAAGLGMGYAGTAARVDDASVVAANPAGMVDLPGTQWSLGGQLQDLRAEPRLAGVSHSNVENVQALPYAYVSHSLSQRWSVGLAVTKPYAFDRQFDTTWAAGLPTRSRVNSLNINPAVAYRVSEQVSVGLGVNYQTLKLDASKVGGGYQAENTSLGWNAGGVYQVAPYMRLGLAYRSMVHHGMPGELGMSTPETLTFSVWQRYSDQWEASGEIARGHLAGLRGSSATVQQAAVAYADTWRAAWGASYRHNDRWSSRFGVAVERVAADAANRQARLGDEQAVWLSVGAQHRMSELGSLDVGLAWRWPSRADVDNASSTGEYRMGGYVAAVQYNHAY